MPSVAYRRCQRIIDILLREKQYLVDDTIRWKELKEVIELEIADDPRTVELYRKRLLRWQFLTEVRKTLFKINQLDRYGHPVTTQTQLKSTTEIVQNALKSTHPRPSNGKEMT